jgi:hypothetical protein
LLKEASMVSNSNEPDGEANPGREVSARAIRLTVENWPMYDQLTPPLLDTGARPVAGEGRLQEIQKRGAA